MMSPEAKQKIQLALLLAMVVAGLRAGYILYQRHEDKVAAEKQKQAAERWVFQSGLLRQSEEALSLRS